MISINTVFDTAILISESKKKKFSIYKKKKRTKINFPFIWWLYFTFMISFNYIECWGVDRNVYYLFKMTF